MAAFIIMAAASVLAADAGDEVDELEPEQLDALRDELIVLRTAPDTRHERAERGRIACEIFGFHDDIETIASDVIADILHWVSLTSGDDAVANAHMRAAKYYFEELR
jgi:hypothetical protein